MFFDPTYLCFMAPAFLLMALTSWYVKSAYKKWSQVRARSGLTGAQAAQRLISTASYASAEGADLRDVRIMGIGGNLTDHYDPRDKTLYLSPGVANAPSVAALAISAHELGHAMQDSENYFPLRLRTALVPAVNIGSNFGWILILAGILLYSWTRTDMWINVAWLGVAVFSAGAVFALATLPVEFNASARAKRLLAESGIIAGEDEQRGVSNVLNAAALTYVAGLVTAILQLLYFVSLVSGLGGRRRS
jgi:Zn-dependent membrane protease YugP